MPRLVRHDAPIRILFGRPGLQTTRPAITLSRALFHTAAAARYSELRKKILNAPRRLPFPLSPPPPPLMSPATVWALFFDNTYVGGRFGSNNKQTARFGCFGFFISLVAGCDGEKYHA